MNLEIPLATKSREPLPLSLKKEANNNLLYEALKALEKKKQATEREEFISELQHGDFANVQS